MKMEKLVLIYNRWSEESGLWGKGIKINQLQNKRKCCIFLIENRFSSHTIHPDQFPPPLLPDAPTSPFPKSTPRLYPIRKKAYNSQAKPNKIC